jgi:hypothetical protein
VTDIGEPDEGAGFRFSGALALGAASGAEVVGVGAVAEDTGPSLMGMMSPCGCSAGGVVPPQA